MATKPYRCTVAVGETKFEGVSSTLRFHTEKDRAGMPQMGSLLTTVRVIADFHDDKNLPNSALKALFTLANVVTRDKIKPVTIEFWKDDKKEEALAKLSFSGWVSRFETCNPHPLAEGANFTQEELINNPSLAYPSLNHVMVLDIEPVLNIDSFKAITLTS